MNKSRIGFIGGGNMARSLIGGLLAEGMPAENIHVAEPDTVRCDALVADFGICAVADNRVLAGAADALLLAVKPQQMQAVCREIAPVVRESRPLLISIAAGLRLQSLASWLGSSLPLVRCMPNTPALVRSGATALYATAEVSKTQRQLATRLLDAVGITIWLEEEDQMDAVTALSGSGPAYFFLVMEAMQQAGEALGLGTDLARRLTLQTALGAARMAVDSEQEPAGLRRQVTSPGGTTERAIRVLREGGLEDLFGRALQGACERSRELAGLSGDGQ